MNRPAILIPPLLAIIILLMLIDRNDHSRRLDAPAPELVAEPVIKVNKVLHQPRQFVMAEGTVGETEALQVLSRYVTDATEEQKRTVQQYTYNLKSYRSEWQDEIDALKSQKSQVETNETFSATSKDEMLREIGFRWQATVISLTSVATRLTQIDRQIMREKGYSDALLDDLWALAYPTGKYPWEE